MSQFTIYQSSDSGAPQFYGTTGSFIALLDSCLVRGYGSQPGAGWIKPITNSLSVNGFNLFGGWQQPTGSGLSLFINDNSPNVTTQYKECWAVGWESLVDLSGSQSNTCGSGSGQFPLPAQSLTTGHVVIRKSTSSDSSSLRPWIVYADSSSLYVFIQTGDTANVYYGFGFGDIYSFKNPINTSTVDNYRCMIMGRTIENSNAAGNDGFDFCSGGTTITTTVGGNYIARSYTGIGSSLNVAKHGDGIKGNVNYYFGNLPMPNNTDNALYLSPVWIVEPSQPTIRGQLRGIYQPLHPIANFADGQTFTGGLDYAGKTFKVVKTTPNSGVYVMETSNTLSTD